MKRSSTVFWTFFWVVLYDVVLRWIFPSSNPITFFSVLLGSLTSWFFWSFLAQIRDFLPRFFQYIFAAIIAAGITVLLAVNIFTFWKLGDFINAYMLVFVSVDKEFVTEQIRLYGFAWPSLLLIPVFLIFFRIWRPLPHTRSRFSFFGLAKCIIWAALLLVVLNQVKYETVGQHKWVDTSFLLAIKNYQKSTRLNVLRASVRAKVPTLKTGGRPDILLFVGESLGRQFLKVYGFERDSTPVMTAAFTEKTAVHFEQQLSNSSATDVSLPSLFSGVGPQESDVKLHELPLIWDWLRSAGYQTVFASPQRFAFANFDAFILSPGPDAYLSADRFITLGSFISHNNGLDDIWAAKKTGEKIAEASKDRPLLLIFFTNATHYPFLQTSPELTEQPKLPTKYENSQVITDHAFAELVRAFKEHRSLDRLLMMVSADHGELENPTKPVPRIASFYDDILGIPLMVRLPPEKGLVKESCYEGFLKNQKSLVQNLDVLPTVLDLVGFADSKEHRILFNQLEGRSLCREVGNERVVVALNTNNIRQWNPEGFLLARNSERLVFTNSEGMRYFRVDQDPKQEKNILSDLSSDQVANFQKVIQENLQLTRIQNLYFPDGLAELQKKVQGTEKKPSADAGK